MKPIKPLGIKAYGSIPHLPGSRRGPGDYGLDEGQARILTQSVRDKFDHIIVQEKLDGSCCSVARIGQVIVALGRAGYPARSSKYPMHHAFADWAEFENHQRFLALLRDGERCVGEWLMQAHGTKYDLPHEPFVIFDLMIGHERLPAEMLYPLCAMHGFTCPRIIHQGGPISIANVLPLLEPSGHGAIDEVEGAVWRVERKGEVDFLGKFVKSSKVDGKYLEITTGGPPVYNWKPGNDKWLEDSQFMS